jgi:hypothetical protein
LEEGGEEKARLTCSTNSDMVEFGLNHGSGSTAESGMAEIAQVFGIVPLSGEEYCGCVCGALFVWFERIYRQVSECSTTNPISVE